MNCNSKSLIHEDDLLSVKMWPNFIPLSSNSFKTYIYESFIRKKYDEIVDKEIKNYKNKWDLN